MKKLRLPRPKTQSLRTKLITFVSALLVLAASAFLFFKFTSPALAAWWQGSSGGGTWTKRLQLPLINNSGNDLAADITASVTINTKALVDQGLLQPDCDDLRLVYHANSSTSKELSRHLIYPTNTSCATSEVTKVYFPLQATLSNSYQYTYYLYYENDKATTPANTDNAFDIGSTDALLVCPFNGTTTCVAGEANTAGTPGAIRYSGSKSAIMFSGTDTAYTNAADYVTSSASSVDSLLANDATIEFWFYWQDDGTTDADGVISKYGGATGWYVSLDKTNNRLTFYAEFNGNNMRYVSTSNAVTKNAWHHLAFSFISASGTAKIFIDGTETSYATQIPGTSGYSDESAYDLVIGNISTNALNYVRGAMDELRISNVIRYPGNFTPKTSPFTADSHTKLLYHFDDNGNYSAGNIVNDDSPYNSTGTANNCSYVSGIVGVDNTAINTGYFDGNHTYSGHAGTFIEEGTTNKITNPSFENATYDQNWTAAPSLTVTQNSTSDFIRFGSNSAKIVNTPFTSYHYKNYSSDQDRLYYDTTQKRIAQGFQVPSNASIYSAVLYSYRTGTDAGSNHYYRVEIQTDNSGVPSNTPVTNGTSSCLYHNNLIISTDSFATFTFSSPPSLTSSTQYHLVLKSYTDSGCTTERSAADNTIFLRWLRDASSPTYANGQRALMSEAGTWTSSSANDLIFALFDESDSPTYTTTIDPNSTATHTLSAYVYLPSDGYTFREILNNREIQLVWEGVAQSSTTHTLIGGGWWRVSYQAATTDASNTYGIYVGPDVTAYVDGFQLEANNYLTSYTDGSLGTDYSWTGTAHNSTSTRNSSSITYPASGNISNTSGTISLWAKFPQASTAYVANTLNYLLAVDSDATGDSFDIRYNKYTNQFDFIKTLNSVNTAVSVSTTFAADTWTHIAATWSNSAGISLVINNGTPATNANTTMPDGFGTSIYIGTDNAPNSEYHQQATVSDVRIFNSALSTTQIADIYFAGLVSRSDTYSVDAFTETKGENPYAIYHFSEGYGTTASDSSPNINHLTVSGATWDTSGNRSLSFDGTNDYAYRAPDNDFNPSTQPFTISGQFKHNSTLPASSSVIVSRYGSAGYKVYMNNSGYLCFGLDFDSTWSPADSACSTQSLADSKWHTFSAVKTASAIYIYVDGREGGSDTSLSSSTSLDTTSNLYIGIDSNGTSNPWAGFIDELYFYPYARSPNQAKADVLGRQTAAAFGSSPADPLTHSLVGYWKMDEASWTGSIDCATDVAFDASGNANHAHSCPTTDGPAGGNSGIFGNSVTFDGTNDYLLVPDNNSLDLTTDITVAVWVKPNGAQNDWDKFVDKSYSGSFAFGIGSGSGRDLSFWTNGTEVVDTDEVLTDNIWQHAVLTYNGSTASIYLNGSLVKSTPYSTPMQTNSQNMGIGSNRLGNGTFFGGSLDDLRIYNRALSPAEVSQLYNWAPGPVAHWKLDEGNGQYAYDSSGNNITATLSSMNWVTGIYGGGLKTTNNNDVRNYAYTADNDLLDFSHTEDFTLETWVKLGPTENSYYRILTKDASSSSRGYYMYAYNNSVLCTYRYDPDPFDTVSFSATMNGWGWHHVSCIMDRDGSETGTPGFYMFVDGILKDSDTSFDTVHDASSDQDFFIGEHSLTSESETSVDDVRIYNYARTPAQIIEDMNAGHPTPGSPVGSASLQLEFENSYGDIAEDSSPQGNDGDLWGLCPGESTCPSRTNNGKFGKALDFDGGDLVLVYDDSSLLYTNGLTLSAWFYSDSAFPATGNYREIAMTSGWALETDGDELSFCLEYGGSWECDTTVKHNLQPNTWYHVVATFDRNTDVTQLFINGKLIIQGSDSRDIPGTFTGGIAIGATYAVTQGWDGKIDDFRLYQSAFTAAQVNTLYNRGFSQVLGSTGTTSTGAASNAAADAYCPPGEGTTCSPPVAHWKMDENTGQYTYNTSGYNLPLILGTSANDNVSDPVWMPGRTGSALSFVNNGIAEAVYTSDPAGGELDITGTDDFSVSVWVKGTSYAESPSILRKVANFSGSSAGYYLVVNYGGGANNLECDAVSTTYDAAIASAPNINDGKWHHVECVLDRNGSEFGAAGLYLYYDGNKLASDTSLAATGSFANAEPLVIGEYDASQEFADGGIDEVKLYKYARTPAQIAWDYNRGAPLAQYNFNECSGSTLHDTAPKPNRSTASYDGTIYPGDNTGNNDTTGTCNDGLSNPANSMWGAGTNGKFNSSLSFDGTNDYVMLDTDVDVSNWTAISVAAWINFSHQSDSDRIQIISKADRTNSGYANTNFRLFQDSSDQINFNVMPNGSFLTTTYATTPVLSPNTWYHIIGTWNGATNTASIYVDGKLVDQYTTTGSGYLLNSNVLNIGRHAANPNSIDFFTGQLDDVRIYNYALTPVQVKTLFNHGSAVQF